MLSTQNGAASNKEPEACKICLDSQEVAQHLAGADPGILKGGRGGGNHSLGTICIGNLYEELGQETNFAL